MIKYENITNFYKICKGKVFGMLLSYYLSLLDTEEEKSKLTQVYDAYRKAMKYEAYSILRHEEDAEDAVHDAFIKIIHCLEKIDEPICHKTKRFVVIVVGNVAKDYLKRNERHAAQSLEELLVEPASTTDDLLKNLNLERILDAVNDLPDIYREVMEMKIYYELSDKQAAEVLCIGPATLRKRVVRARDLLNVELDYKRSKK